MASFDAARDFPGDTFASVLDGLGVAEAEVTFQPQARANALQTPVRNYGFLIRQDVSFVHKMG